MKQIDQLKNLFFSTQSSPYGLFYENSLLRDVKTFRTQVFTSSYKLIFIDVYKKSVRWLFKLCHFLQSQIKALLNNIF